MKTIQLQVEDDNYESFLTIIKISNWFGWNYNDIPNMPFKYRKSIYFNDNNIRDLIFKGYVVPYKIDTVKNQIIIIGINKYMEKLI